MKYNFTLALLLVLNLSISQNLVLNPSFEIHKNDKCPVWLGGFDKNISNWSIPNFGSTDFFDTCSEDYGAKNYNGFQKPKSGSTYAGIYTFTDKSYREYIQGQLSQTLIKGEEYTMTFYLSLAEKSSFALKDIEVLFTEEELKSCYNSNNCEKTIKPKSVTKKKFKLYSDNSDVFFVDKKSWKPYVFKFIAEGYENYFSIGNFHRNSKTKKQRVLSNSPYFFSYYYIDDVSIIANNSIITEKPKVISNQEVKPETKIKTNKIYTFNNVLFDFDKAELLKVSKTELNTLFEYLYRNKNSKVEIYGHTDNVGLVKRNDELSRLRAKAVADYLILLGINNRRVDFFGFGSKKPITTNDTEKGRQQNRRVEFKIIKEE